MGLYAAFASEGLVRVPARPRESFALLVGLATEVIVFTAGLLQRRLVRRWAEEVADSR